MQRLERCKFDTDGMDGMDGGFIIGLINWADPFGNFVNLEVLLKSLLIVMTHSHNVSNAYPLLIKRHAPNPYSLSH